ncbi:uncharacterized protein LOC133830326 [Humulus lupulus]|uniref:uncharacterized protein LOC133830326 n=1 Tax=Humulus lupulus TaxID=3486 RepID=UPI002B409A10|nr:uncharacterized protein LOC133830326 [Humulus lupulus]
MAALKMIKEVYDRIQGIMNKRGALLWPIKQFWVMSEALSMYPEALQQLNQSWNDVVLDDMEFSTMGFTICDFLVSYDLSRQELVLVKTDDGEIEEHLETVHDMEGESAVEEVLQAIPRLTARMEIMASAPNYFHIPEDIFDYNSGDESTVED